MRLSVRILPVSTAQAVIGLKIGARFHAAVEVICPSLRGLPCPRDAVRSQQAAGACYLDLISD
jgi:hypothetical protein